MDYDQLIENWHTKTSAEDVFSKFVFEYLAFIAFLRRRKFESANNDRDAIQELKRDNATKGTSLQRIKTDQHLKQVWEKIKDELTGNPLRNVSRGIVEKEWWNCSAKSCQSGSKPKGVIHDLEDWENMVEFWYSIRNNLFHGGKDPHEERDQFFTENGYKTLSQLVEIFLRPSRESENQE